jgi:hypothetical protein
VEQKARVTRNAKPKMSHEKSKRVQDLRAEARPQETSRLCRKRSGKGFPETQDKIASPNEPGSKELPQTHGSRAHNVGYDKR